MLRRAVTWHPVRVNVQLGEHDTPPAEAARYWIAMMKLAADLGLTIDLELHRDAATETVEKSMEIAERYRQATGQTIRFCLDYSHFAVGKHFAPPFAPRLLAARELIAPVRQFHMRPFNGHHAQIPMTNGRDELTPEAKE
jgi:sugar phosphate isomerase/epimerase